MFLSNFTIADLKILLVNIPVTVVLFVTSVTGWIMYCSKSPIPYDTADSLAEKVALAEESYDRFMEMSSLDLHIAWHTKYHEVKYEMNGRPQRDEYDCSTSVIWFTWDFGSLAVMESSKEIADRLERVSVKRKKKEEVRHTDIVIFRRGHAAMVEGIDNKGYVMYMEVGGTTGGVAYLRVPFHDRGILGIYKLSKAWWCGKVLQSE